MKKGIIGSVIAAGIAFTGYFGLTRKAEDKAPYLSIFGHPARAGGTSHQTIELIEVLQDDVDLECIPTRKVRSNEKIPRTIRRFLANKPNSKGKVVLFEESLWSPENPDLFQKWISSEPEEKLRISYSKFDATEIPHEWVFILNNYFDAVAVPNLFLADVYEKSGVQIPIFEVPLGMDLKRFLNEPNKKRSKGPLVFANFSPCEERSNHLVLISAFAKAFGNREDVILKINTNSSEQLLRQFLQWEIEDLGLQNVQFTNLYLDSDTYFELFKTVDCYVSLSKGEGFAYQPREAMALGIPVIAVNNTAQSGLCESGLVRAVSSNNVQQARHFNFGNVVCGKFFNCDVNEVSAALLDVYENYEEHLAKAEKGREWVQQWEYENLKDFYLNLIKPKKVMFGDENKITTEYLMTNSKILFDKYQKT